MSEPKPKLKLSNYLINRIAFNYAENYVGKPKTEITENFKKVMEAVKYGINMGLNSEYVEDNAESKKLRELH